MLFNNCFCISYMECGILSEIYDLVHASDE